MLGSEPAATSITNFREFSVLYSGLKSTKKSTCITGHPYTGLLLGHVRNRSKMAANPVYQILFQQFGFNLYQQLFIK